ncbi:unnamed protein product [Peronospora belbahrii]|uniref:Uncharacterized protein n=1 Tax=Peronospora belbahrii TaxID=622444 RepID=A0ABN8CUI2_9STRA|nr:unnamed protein product [Peronospora belbahrii]
MTYFVLLAKAFAGVNSGYNSGHATYWMHTYARLSLSCYWTNFDMKRRPTALNCFRPQIKADVPCISPTFTFLLLGYLSGVPLAEDRYDERFGLDPDYLEYKHSTSPLIMLPPFIYRSFPNPIKRWCLFELKRYSRKLQELRSTEHKASRATYQAIS